MYVNKMAKSFLYYSDRKVANRNIISFKLKETIEAFSFSNITVNRADQSNITLYVIEMEEIKLFLFLFFFLSEYFRLTICPYNAVNRLENH